MKPKTIGSMFSGYGGLDLAVEKFFGAETVWHCEFEEAPSKVLAAHWDVPNFGDVTKVDWEKVEPIDILTGGFPCQDVSLAGRRAGMKEGTRSGLWSEMVKAIETLEPGLVIIENVRGLLSAEAHSEMEPCTWCVGDEPGQPVLRALGAVLGDLSSLGYDAEWHSLRASDVGACHGRFRVFIIAYTDRERISRWVDESRKGTSGGTNSEAGGTNSGADRGYLSMLPTPRATDFKGSNNPDVSIKVFERGFTPNLSEAVSLLPTPNTMDMLPAREGEALEKARRRGDGRQKPSTVQNLRERVIDDYDLWGKYALAIDRWEKVIDRKVPPPTELSKQGKRQLSSKFVEWMMGLPDGWVTGHGLTRNEELKMLGNGVVPQQAYRALQDLFYSDSNV